MNTSQLKREHLDGASNVLVLAPLTPSGSSDFIDLVATTPPDEMNLLSVTYTQPPHLWVDDWRSSVGALPNELAFIHAGRMQSPEDELEDVPSAVNTSAVDPRDPMEIIAPVSQNFDRWADSGAQTVLSVQTLTVLLEYVDFDTVFRYLHILTHKVNAADARGYYQADPDLHDQEALNTLKVLFDIVVEASDDGWVVSPPGNREDVPSERTEMLDDAPSSVGADPDRSTPSPSTSTDRSGAETDSASGAGLGSMVARAVERLRAAFSLERLRSTGGSTDQPKPQETPESVSGGTPEAEIEDEMLLTDEERIRQLLLQSGGRMKQTDIVSQTEWSRSSVSRKLSAMEETGMITRFQIGRGNLVFLSGYEPDAADSPYEQATN